MAGLPPSTSADIAKAADLDERYVREVLGALTTGGITTYDGDLGTYTLPGEHAALLTRAAGVGNMAALTQFVAMLGSVEQDIVTCFREGGGVPYAKFPTFHRLMAELSKETIDATLIDGTLGLVDGLRERLGGRHRRGRHRLRGRLRHERPRPRLPEQPLHRLRLLGGGDHRGPCAGRGVGPHQRHLRGARRDRPRDHRTASTW